WQHYLLGDSREQSTVDKCRKILCEIHQSAESFPYPYEKKADLIFIDTVHEYDFLKIELNIWKQLAHEKTVWLFHDTWMFGFYNHMTDAIKEFAEESGIWEYVDITQEAHGLGMLKPKK
ncbi:MAG: class I SAM-dependent methyltransferase, partial [Candidatus Gracilibacteria bacterium]